MPLHFLMSLESRAFPVVMHTAAEMKWVSTLAATGLIEADLQPPFSTTGPTPPLRSATVLAITDAGKTEIESIRVAVREEWGKRRPRRRQDSDIHDLSELPEYPADKSGN